MQVYGDLSRQTPRGIAVLAAAYLDGCLQLGLQSRLCVSSAKLKHIFSPAGFLFTLSAKRDCAYAFGIIGHDTHHDIKLVGEIRNKFAHWTLASVNQGPPEELSFDIKEIAEMCMSLKLPTRFHFRTQTGGVAKNPKDPSLRYIGTCAIVGGLIGRLRELSPAPTSLEESLP